MLDGHGRILRRSPLHGDEHDEQRAAAERLRSRRLRHRGDVRAGTGLRKRPARCSTGTTTTATTPTRRSASTAATCPSISSRTCAWTSRRSSPARSASRTRSAPAWPGESGPMTFARVSTNDRTGRIARLRGRGPASPTIRWKPSAAPAWWRFRACRSCCATSARTASSITWRPIFPRWPTWCTRPATRYLGWDMYRHKAQGGC